MNMVVVIGTLIKLSYRLQEISMVVNCLNNGYCHDFSLIIQLRKFYRDRITETSLAIQHGRKTIEFHQLIYSSMCNLAA